MSENSEQNRGKRLKKKAKKKQKEKKEEEIEIANENDQDEFDEEELERDLNFHEMELDNRILKAIAKLGWSEPSFIQAKAIPILLSGKDVLLKARTGSGKTAAFAIPVIQKILNIKKYISKEQATRALVLAPTHELCTQIHKNFKELTSSCSDVSTCLITTEITAEDQIPLLLTQPDVVIGLPIRILHHMMSNKLLLKKSLEILVIDEADLLLTFGYDEYMKGILSFLPPVYQTIFASATLSDKIDWLKGLVMHNPVTIKLTENVLLPTRLTNYYLEANEEDKAVAIYTLLKLKLVMGRTLIFVNTVDKCYKLKLYLEQFGIPSCLINSELPANVRNHALVQFNSGKYDIVIASDEWTSPANAKPENKKKDSKGQKSKRKKDEASGVARGIDFREVSNVINFDFPHDVNSYVHRAGRTARGQNQGYVLSLVNMTEQVLLKQVEAAIQESYRSNAKIMQKFDLKMEELDGFRYRSQDAWRAVTRIAVREARLKEIKQEIFNSKELKGYFQDNPRDFSTLRHDKALHTVKLQQHLHDVPEYLVPPVLRGRTLEMRQRKKKSRWQRFGNEKCTVTQKRFKRKTEDPLSLQFTFKKRNNLKKSTQKYPWSTGKTN